MFQVSHEISLGSSSSFDVSEVEQKLSFALPGSFPTNTVTVEAQEALGGHRAVTALGFYADATKLDQFLGITIAACASGDDAVVVVRGVVEEPSWNWTANQPIFISGLGVLTQTAPSSGAIRRIAWALSSTAINVDPFPIIQQ